MKAVKAMAKAMLPVIAKAAGWPFDRVDPGDLGGPGVKLTKAYAQSAWVMRAIKTIAGPIASVPIRFSTDSREGEQLLEDDRLSLFWERPAVRLDSQYDFVEASIGWLKLAGEVFWILGDDWLRPFPEVGELPRMIVGQPGNMRHIVTGGVLLGWEYRDGAGNLHALLPEQVIQLKNWNPYDEWRGLGELEAAAIATESDYLAGVYQRNLMRNNGDRGPYLVAKGGLPTDEQQKQIVAQLRAKRRAAQQGDYRPVFLTGDIEVEDPQLQSPDAAFQAGRLHNRHEIFIALGVPASMADVQASYSIGSASDRFRLIEDTCMPAGVKLAEGIEAVSRRLMRRMDLFAWLDWDEHSTMQAVRAERIDSAVKLWGMGMPPEKINEYLMLGMPDWKGWKTGYLPFSVAPVGGDTAGLPDEDPTLDDPAAEPLPEGDDDSPEIAAMLRALQAKASDDRDPREVAQWREHMARRRAAMKDYASKFKGALMVARKETLQRLASQSGGSKTIENRAAAVDLVFDRETFRAGLLAAMRRAAANSLQLAATQLAAELDIDDPFEVPPEEVTAFVERRQNRLSGVADHTWERIRDSIQEGLDAGDTMNQISDRVRVEFNDVASGRAETIAQTETAAAYGTGRQEAMKRAGVRRRRWLTSGNSNVRPAHRNANGQTVGIDEAFQVGGEELMHPGDPRGSAANVINCHCVAIPVKDEDS